MDCIYISHDSAVLLKKETQKQKQNEVKVIKKTILKENYW